MKLVLCLLLAAVCGPVFADDLIRNGSFETESKDFSADWKSSPAFLSEGWVTLDREKAASGKNSLRLRKPSGQGVVSCTQEIALPSGKTDGLRRLDLRVNACADNVALGQLVVITRDAEKKMLQWVRLFVFKGTFDFHAFRKTFEVHPDAVSLVVSLRAPRRGILWLDDVSLSVLKSDEVDLDFKGEKSPVTGLPGLWSEKRYHGNENVSQVSFASENGRTFAVQKYVTGGPLSGFTAPLPEGLARQKYLALTLCQKSVQVVSIIAGSGLHRGSDYLWACAACSCEIRFVPRASADERARRRIGGVVHGRGCRGWPHGRGACADRPFLRRIFCRALVVR